MESFHGKRARTTVAPTHFDRHGRGRRVAQECRRARRSSVFRGELGYSSRLKLAAPIQRRRPERLRNLPRHSTGRYNLSPPA